MTTFLRQLSAFAFYVLGSSFFVAYVLLHNSIRATEAATWMQIADLPLAFSSLTYGGLSLYLSMNAGTSKTLAWLIAIPLIAFFALLVTLNFWPR